MKKFIFMCMLLLCWGCQSTDPLEEALELAGENRGELEQVIAHYSRSPDDSLSLKAAIFLIENMPGHYTAESEDLQHYRNGMDSLYPQMSNVVKSVVYTIPLRVNLGIHPDRKVEDVKVMKADYLIKHIDNMIAIWENCTWLKYVSFEEFCEYVLPYRVTNEPILPSDSTITLWKEIKGKMRHYEYVPSLLSDIKSFQRNIIGNNDDVYFLNMNVATSPQSTYTFDCLDNCFYNVLGYRLSGIPSTVDFVPFWGHRNGKHYWLTFIEPTSLSHNDSDIRNVRAGKVYRMTYSHHKCPDNNGIDSIPLLFQSPFIKDVSPMYIQVTDVKVSVKNVQKDLYLSVFNNLEWQPIAWGERKGKTVLFKDMGRNLVYLPTYFDGKEKCYLGYPLWVHVNGEIEELQPDILHKVDLHLTRKYPLTYSKVHWGIDLEGCYLEASNRKDFSNPDTLGRIVSVNPSLGWNHLAVQSLKAYRYWRISKFGRPLPFAEIEFYNGEKELNGYFFQRSGIPSDKAFDKDMLTYASYLSWIGLDFKIPTTVTDIRFLPRTDDNGINEGEEYELFYYAEDGWVSLGCKVATSQELVFPAVPSHALYWLRNTVKGKEERIFIWHDGQCIFL